jgi:flagellar motor switch protein FliM
MENGGAVLRKMIDRAGAKDAPILSLAAEALDMTLGKVARQLFDCEGVLKDGAVEQMVLQPMLDSAAKPGLLVVVRAGGCLGLLGLDGMLINGLVELMAGASNRAVHRDPREPTLIDIALCREFCDTLLAEFPRKLAALSGHAGICDLIWQEPETEASRLAFILENQTFAQLSGKVNLQDGLRGGTVSLALPLHVWQGGGGKNPNADNPDWSRDLAENLLSAPLPLRANLEKIELSLARAMALKPGDTLEISGFALSDLELVTRQGTPLLRGRLGQENGKKAIAIEAACDTPAGPVLHVKPAKRAAQPAPPTPDMTSPDLAAATVSDADMDPRPDSPL